MRTARPHVGSPRPTVRANAPSVGSGQQPMLSPCLRWPRRRPARRPHHLRGCLPTRLRPRVPWPRPPRIQAAQHSQRPRQRRRCDCPHPRRRRPHPSALAGPAERRRRGRPRAQRRTAACTPARSNPPPGPEPPWCDESREAPTSPNRRHRPRARSQPQQHRPRTVRRPPRPNPPRPSRCCLLRIPPIPEAPLRRESTRPRQCRWHCEQNYRSRGQPIPQPDPQEGAARSRRRPAPPSAQASQWPPQRPPPPLAAPCAP
eukprot:scaffold1496_cov110-Isochrysis_galbana.AAC.5